MIYGRHKTEGEISNDKGPRWCVLLLVASGMSVLRIIVAILLLKRVGKGRD